MSEIIVPRGASRASHHQHASCPPLAILRPKARGAPSDQRMSYRSCFEFHRSAARALDAARVQAFAGDARAVLANVRVGVDAALADRAAVERHLPYVPVAQLLALADVARALVFAEAHGEADDRDRLWTLLAQRHAFVRKVGWYFHGERCEEVVPPLGASARRALDDEDESFDATG
jgi:hypothetical protein